MEEDRRPLDKNLRELILNTGLPLRAFARLVGVTSEQCLLWWSDSKNLPPNLQFENLSSFLGANISQQGHADSDLKKIRQHMSVTNYNLPERYAYYPLSYVSSSRHIVKLLRYQYGREKAHEILSGLSVNYNYFEDIRNKINLRFFEDLLSTYVAQGNGVEHFDYLSRALFLSIENTALAEFFQRTASYEEAYQQIECSVPQFDLNFEYKFSISKSGVELTTKPSEALAESMKNKRYGSELLYRYRAGLFGNMVMLCNLRPVKLAVKACISQGDSVCRYVGAFPGVYA